MLAAGIGGSITLISFLVLPHFSVPLIGGLKMPTIIGLLSQVEPNFLVLVVSARSSIAHRRDWPLAAILDYGQPTSTAPLDSLCGESVLTS